MRTQVWYCWWRLARSNGSNSNYGWNQCQCNGRWDALLTDQCVLQHQKWKICLETQHGLKLSYMYNEIQHPIEISDWGHCEIIDDQVSTELAGCTWVAYDECWCGRAFDCYSLKRDQQLDAVWLPVWLGELLMMEWDSLVASLDCTDDLQWAASTVCLLAAGVWRSCENISEEDQKPTLDLVS